MELLRSTFYDAMSVAPDADVLLAGIGAICDEYECYGYRRVGAVRPHQGTVVNGKKLRRLMREHGLQPKRRWHNMVTTDSHHVGLICPDLANDLILDRLNQFWLQN